MSEVESPSASQARGWADPGRLAAVAFLVVAVVALVLGAVAVWQVSRTPFPGLFTEPTLVINDLGSLSWPGYAAGLRFPVQLVALDDQPLQRSTALMEVLSQYRVGQTVVLTARDPSSGSAIEARVPLTQLPREALLDFFLLPNLLGWACLIIAIWVVRSARRGPAATVFIALCANLAVVGGLLFDVYTTHVAWWAWVLSIPLAGSLGLHLALVFPEPAGLVRRARWLPLLVYLPGVALGIAGVVAAARWDAPTAYFAPWFWGRLWSGIGVLGLAAVTVGRRFLSPSPVLRAQTRTILWGTLVAFGPYVVWVLVARLSHVPFPPSLVLPLMVMFPLSIGYTLLPRRALDIGWVVRRTITYLVLGTAAVLAYLLVLAALGAASLLPGSLAHPLVLVVLALLVAFGVQPARVAIQRLVDRVVLGRRLTPEQARQEFAREVAAAQAEEDVAEALGRVLERALTPSYAVLYVLDGRSGEVVPRVLGGDPPALVQFPAEGPLARRLAAESEPLYAAGGGDLLAELVHEQEQAASLAPALLVPLSGLGWLAVGPTRLRRFRAGDVSLLESLARQVVAALERVRLVSDRDQRVQEIEALRLIAQAVSFSVELDDLMELIYTQTSRILNATNFYIALHDPDTRTFRFAFFVEDGERHHPDDVWPDTERLSGVILRTGLPIVTEDYLVECQRRGVQPAGKPAKAWMGLPLVSRDRVLGVINVSSFDPDVVYGQEHIQVFRAIADQAAAILVKTYLYQEMERRARQLEALNEVGSAVISSLDLDVVLNLILRKAVELVQVEAGSLVLVEEDTGDLVFRVVSGPRTADLVGTRLPMGTGIVGRAAKQGRPILVDNVQRDERWYDRVDEKSGFVTRSAICVPMILRARVIGVIQLLNRQDGNPFDADDRRLLTAFAAQAAVALENARLFTMTDQALAARVEELAMMQRVDRELNASLDYRRVMEITLDWALRLTGADVGVVGVVVETEEGRRGLRILVSRGYPDALLAELEREPLSLDRGLVGRAVRTGTPELVEDVGTDPDYWAAVPGMVAQLTVPIRREEQIIGVVALESSERDCLDQEAMEFVTRLADHAAIAIENARLFEAVQAANNAKNEFISFVSHELKQPMTSIQGYSDMLLKGTVGELTESQESFLNVIHSSVARMDALVQDLLDVSRIEAGRLRLEIGQVAFEQAVDEAVGAVQRQVEAKEQALELELHKSLPPVAADRNRLVQVLTNLLTNAYKYTPQGGTIRILAEPMDGDWVRCSVSDTGIGMTPDEQERLFTKYFRSQHPVVRSVPGTGLGLVITKSLVELQGGEIWVESEPDQGSTFSFTVPVMEGRGGAVVR